MLLPREFFESLNDGDEYLTILMKRDDFNEIPKNSVNKMVVNTVRKNNKVFETDPTHIALSKKSRDAKKELRNYEFKINYK